MSGHLLETLRYFVCIEERNAEQYFENYLKIQIELFELKLISSFYNLKNKEEVNSQIKLLNERYGINVDSKYLASRWEDFYSRVQNEKFDDKTKSYILNRDSWCCSYCKFDKKLEVHHVIPQKMNGSHSFYNLVCACENCNRSISDNIKLSANWWDLHPKSRNKIVV